MLREEAETGVLVVVTASLQWGRSSLSPSSSRPVRCSIDVTAAPSLRPRGHCGVPHSGIGPFAAVVAWEHLGCGALGFVQSTCSCSTPALLLSAAIQPAPHNCSLPTPSSSGTAVDVLLASAAVVVKRFAGVKIPVKGQPLSCSTLTQPKCKVGAPSCRVWVVLKHGCTPSPAQGLANQSQGQ